MQTVKKCKQCFGSAAKCFKEKVHSLRRSSDPGSEAVYVSDIGNSPEHHVSFNDLFYQEEPRGRRLARSHSRDFSQSYQQIPSRSSSLPFSTTSGCELSPFPTRHFPVPDPSITLPSPPNTLLRRCTSKCNLKRSNSPSRSCMIRASCIPQLEWTRADCRDWIAACFQEVYGVSPVQARWKASAQMEGGDGIYFTELDVWQDRWPWGGPEMYDWLEECRNQGFVKGLKPGNGNVEVGMEEHRSGPGEQEKEE